MYLLTIMQKPRPVRNSRIFLVYTASNPTLVNLTNDTKTMLNAVLDMKDVMNHILTFTGAPNCLWFLSLMYVVYILNITANGGIDNISPHQHFYGHTLDIPIALCF